MGKRGPKPGFKQSAEHIEKRMRKIRGIVRTEAETRLRVANRRKHYGGEWGPTGRPKITSEEIWKRIDKRGPDECWLWVGTVERCRYGRIYIDGRSYYAHRVVYDLVNPGQITKNGPTDRNGYGFVRHTCDNPTCCNPSHLILGTQMDNARDKIERGRQPKTGSLNSPRAKLNREQVLELRELWKNGMAIGRLMQKFGLSRSGVCGVAYRRTYKDIP